MAKIWEETTMNRSNHFPLKKNPFTKNLGSLFLALFFTTFFLLSCQSKGSEIQKTSSTIWETSSLDEANINPELISSLIQDIQKNQLIDLIYIAGSNYVPEYKDNSPSWSTFMVSSAWTIKSKAC